MVGAVAPCCVGVAVAADVAATAAGAGISIYECSSGAWIDIVGAITMQ